MTEFQYMIAFYCVKYGQHGGEKKRAQTMNVNCREIVDVIRSLLTVIRSIDTRTKKKVAAALGGEVQISTSKKKTADDPYPTFSSFIDRVDLLRRSVGRGAEATHLNIEALFSHILDHSYAVAAIEYATKHKLTQLTTFIESTDLYRKLIAGDLSVVTAHNVQRIIEMIDYRHKAKQLTENDVPTVNPLRYVEQFAKFITPGDICSSPKHVYDSLGYGILESNKTYVATCALRYDNRSLCLYMCRELRTIHGDNIWWLEDNILDAVNICEEKDNGNLDYLADIVEACTHHPLSYCESLGPMGALPWEYINDLTYIIKKRKFVSFADGQGFWEPLKRPWYTVSAASDPPRSDQ